MQYYTILYNIIQILLVPCNIIQYPMPNLSKDESSNHDSTNCSEISAVTWFRNCSGLLQVADIRHEIGACGGSKT